MREGRSTIERGGQFAAAARERYGDAREALGSADLATVVGAAVDMVALSPDQGEPASREPFMRLLEAAQ